MTSKRLMGTLAVTILLTATAMAQTTSTDSQQCDAYNNTSAVSGGFDLSNGNAAAWNISKVPTRKLLYPNATTRVYAHFLPWSCMPGRVESDGVTRCNGHVVTGYDSNDVYTVGNQINDMISRGADGVIVDYYRTTLEDQTTMKVRDEAAKHPNFELAVMEDKENYKTAPDPEARAQKIVADAGYINSTYFSSPAYMRRNGRPVLFVFQDESAVNWKLVRDGVRALGNPLLIFMNDFDHAEADGAFAWINACADPIAALNDFYARAKAHPGSLVWGAAFPGFDDHLATWGAKRIVNRRVGQLWLDSFASARNNYSSSGELSNIQLVTWNDYDEGTEIESGIDSGTSISGKIEGTVLTWIISGGTEGTIDSFRVFTSRYPDRERLTLRAEVPAGGVHSLDLGSLPSGDYEVFVQAQGQPSFRNHTADAGRFTRGANPQSRTRAVRPHCISISSPANCAVVSSPPIHVVACEDTPVRATAMQIYLDGKLTVDRLNVECLDEQVPAGPGAHQIVVKAWYADGSNCLSTILNVIVIGAPVTISSPANGATVTSPIHVIADENTPAVATAMQIYLDGTLYLTRDNVDHLDEQVPAGPGAHQIVVKAWYSDGSNKEATVRVTVASAPVTISSPANGATVTSPIHVIADENTPAPATSMQIYLDGTLYVERPNVDHLDEQVMAGAGGHAIVVKAWYCDGSNNLATVNVTVISAPVTISSPTNGATVSSPIHVIACENTPAAATAMQIYLDGTLYIEGLNIDCLDEQVTAGPGVHEIAVKAWYGDGSNNLAIVSVTVISSAPVTISSPTNGATVSSPIHVIADENTPAATTSMQIYLDGTLYLERFNVEHLDEQVTAGAGVHEIAAKAWYADGSNHLTLITVTVP